MELADDNAVMYADIQDKRHLLSLRGKAEAENSKAKGYRTRTSRATIEKIWKILYEGRKDRDGYTLSSSPREEEEERKIEQKNYALFLEAKMSRKDT